MGFMAGSFSPTVPFEWFSTASGRVISSGGIFGQHPVFHLGLLDLKLYKGFYVF